jgi:hypothetical protein
MANKGAIGRQMVDWQHSLEQKWATLRFGEVKVETKGGSTSLRFRSISMTSTPRRCGSSFTPTASTAAVPVRQEMKRVRQLAGAPGGYVYSAAVSAARPPTDYTARVIPQRIARPPQAEYFQMGARFAKWRAVIAIGDGIPSRGCIEANAQALARYAALCQEAGLVPVVEPEVLMDGEHTLERCREVTEEVLRTVFNQLHTNG